jgi:predicted dehydrogenase
MTKIRTAILGYGRSGGTMHAGAIEKNADFELVAACDVDPERLKQAQARFPSATLYDNYRTMLRREKLDLVCIITRSDQHAAMAVDTLKAGVNTLVTKPWARNRREAERMIRAAESSGRLLLPWLPARWGCDLKRLTQLVRGGAIGNVFLVRRAVCSFATRADWQTERRYGGGYLLNWGPHIVDPATLLAGGKVVSAYARLRQTINPGDAEDMFLGLLTMDNGCLVQVDYAIACEDLPNWFIQGDRGTIAVRGKTVRLHTNTPAKPADPTQFYTMKAAGDTVAEETLEGSPYGDEHEIYAEIAQALRGEKSYPVRPEDALELTRVLDAMRTSSEKGRAVTL